MKSILLSFICVFYIGNVAGQTELDPLIQSEYMAKSEGIEGHPFLFEEYNQADLKTASGNIDQVMVRYNVTDNNLIAQVSGKEYILKKDLIEAFTLYAKAKSKQYSFVALQIGAKKYFVEAYYEDGNGTRFLEWHRKQFVKGKPQPSYGVHGDSPDKFEEVTSQLFVINDQIIEYSKKKNDLLQILSQSNPELKTYLANTIKDKKLKANNEQDVITLLKLRADYIAKNL